ncbi:MAG: alpha/beta fold hydrolase [Pseudomonadota bacterium]
MRATVSADAPNIKEYAQLPTSGNLVISPDGKHYAFMEYNGDDVFFAVMDAATRGIIGGGKLGSQSRGRSVYFATNDHVLIRASMSQRTGRGNKYTYTGAYSYSIPERKTRVLLNGHDELYRNQSGLGKVVGINAEERVAYMPGFSDRRGVTYDLFVVDLDKGGAKRLAGGRPQTLDWWVNAKGDVLAREDFNSRKDRHQIFAYRDGKPVEIYSAEGTLPEFSVVGVGADEKSLLFIDQHGDYDAVFSLSLEDGSRSGPLYFEDGREIDRLDLDLNRKLQGVRFSGLDPVRHYIDPNVASQHERVRQQFPHSSVHYVTSTQDNVVHLFDVSGHDTGRIVVRAQTDTDVLTIVNRSYPAIRGALLQEVETWMYTSRDGLDIPSLITWPAESDETTRANLPLIVLPHGGPESYDHRHFDWLAQAIASRGYAVLQPNFRGSVGFGTDFMLAGRGKWGTTMQDDLTDGVHAMVEKGWVDPERVCIVGASYGGYAALAGGAFTPDVYRCVVAIAGVSNLPLMLADTTRRRGRNHWVNDYWAMVIGDRKEDRDKLKAISPVNFADAFVAPVLLIHGRDDSVVPYRQSTIMEKALRKAKSDAELVLLKGEDHYLSKASTRAQTLTAIEAFLLEHNPP